MRLHAVKHDLKTTLWCGPAALSAVTGKPTSHVVEAIRQSVNPAYRHKPIKGVSNTILVRAAELLGCEVTRVFEQMNYQKGTFLQFRELPTLARYCREHKELLRREVLIVNVTGHYVVVSGRSFVDNHTGKVVPLSKAPHRRCRVQNVWMVRADRKPDKVAPPVPKPVDHSAKYRRESKALALQYGIFLEPHLPGETWVYPPTVIERLNIDPYEDEHLAFDWADVRGRVQRYVELVKTHVLQEVT